MSLYFWPNDSPRSHALASWCYGIIFTYNCQLELNSSYIIAFEAKYRVHAEKRYKLWPYVTFGGFQKCIGILPHFRAIWNSTTTTTTRGFHEINQSNSRQTSIWTVVSHSAYLHPPIDRYYSSVVITNSAEHNLGIKSAVRFKELILTSR